MPIVDENVAVNVNSGAIVLVIFDEVSVQVRAFVVLTFYQFRNVTVQLGETVRVSYV